MFPVTAVDHLTLGQSEICENINLHQKDPPPEGVSPASEESRRPPEPDHVLHLNSPSIEDEHGLLLQSDEEEFEETLIEPRTLNELTSVTDKTSPWTSVLSDPDLSSVESENAVTEPPVVDLRHDGDTSSPPDVTSDTPRAQNSDSDLSTHSESDEDAAGEEEGLQQGNEDGFFITDSKKNSSQPHTEERDGWNHDGESDLENDSPLTSCSESSIKANSEHETEEQANQYPLLLVNVCGCPLLIVNNNQ